MNKKYNEYEKKLISNVNEHGWQYNHVFDPEGKDPDFTYSIGFPQTLNAPEIIVFGLPKHITQHMLWEMFRQVKDGAMIFDGAVWEDLLEGHFCITRKAMHKDLYSEYLVSSNWFWKETGNEGPLEVYQLVWPGAVDGRFPWDKNCSQDVIDAQFQLWS